MSRDWLVAGQRARLLVASLAHFKWRCHVNAIGFGLHRSIPKASGKNLEILAFLNDAIPARYGKRKNPHHCIRIHHPNPRRRAFEWKESREEGSRNVE